MKMPPKKMAWAVADHRREPRQSSRSKYMLPAAAILLQGLCDDAHVGDACLLHGIHQRGERTEGHLFVGAQVNRLALGIAHLLPQLRRNLIDVDGVVAQEYPLF